MFQKHDLSRNQYMLLGPLAWQGYDWWWHSFTAIHAETGEEKQFFIEYFLCNPARGGDEPVFGQLPENQAMGIKPSYLMVKAGSWGEDHAQLHRFFGWSDVDVSRKSGALSADDCYADNESIRGSVSVSAEDAAAHPEWMCDSGSMSWNLTMEKDIAFHVGYGTSTPLRAMNAFEMYWHAEGIKTRFSGTVTWNGQEYQVLPERSFGYADKNWGRNFTSPWVWLASSHLTSKKTGKLLENSAFDIGGGCPKIYHMALDRKLLGAFWYEGTGYEFNFSKLWTGTRTKFDFKETDTSVYWYVRQENLTAVMETMICCRKKDMILVNYEAPDGQKRHNRLWNGGNGFGKIKLFAKKQDGLKLIDEIEASHVGCEYGEYCEAEH